MRLAPRGYYHYEAGLLRAGQAEGPWDRLVFMPAIATKCVDEIEDALDLRNAVSEEPLSDMFNADCRSGETAAHQDASASVVTAGRDWRATRHGPRRRGYFAAGADR